MPYSKKTGLFFTVLLLLSNGIIAETSVNAISNDLAHDYAVASLDNININLPEHMEDFEVKDNIHNYIKDSGPILHQNINTLRNILKTEHNKIIKTTYSTSVVDSTKTSAEISEQIVRELFEDAKSVLNDTSINPLAIIDLIDSMKTTEGFLALKVEQLGMVIDGLTSVNNLLGKEIKAKKQAKQAEAIRLAAEDEAIRLAAEAEAKAEADRLAAEAAEIKAKAKETDRLAAEAKAKETDRLAAEAKAKADRLAAEAEQDKMDKDVFEANMNALKIGGSGIALVGLLISSIRYLNARKKLSQYKDLDDSLEGMREKDIKERRADWIRPRLNRKIAWVSDAMKAGSSIEEAEKIAAANEKQWAVDTFKPISVKEDDNRRQTFDFYKKNPKVAAAAKNQKELREDEKDEYLKNLHLTEEPLEKEINKQLTNAINKAMPEEARRIMLDTADMNYKDKKAYIENNYKVPTSTCSIQ